MVKRTAKILEIDITEEGAKAIAKRSRGTPRIANRLVKRVSDFAIVKFDGQINEDVCEPYLLQAGLLQRTPRGRKVSPEGYRHLGIKMPSEQTSLF